MPLPDLLTRPREAAPQDWRARAWRVRGVRLLLPALALALLTALMLWTRPQEVPPPPEPAPAEALAGRSWDNTLDNPRYAGLDEGGHPYVVSANRALQDGGEGQPVLLEAPRALLTLEDGRQVTGSAALGRYDAAAQSLALLEGATLTLDGHTLRTPSLTLDLAAQTAHGAEPVEVDGPDLALSAAGLDGDVAQEVLTFAGPAHMVLKAQSVAVTAADTMAWRRKEQVFVATGAATAAQGESRLAADVLEATYVPKQGGGLAVTDLRARGHVVATSGAGRAEGGAGHYDVAGGLGRMTGPDLTATLPKGEVLTARDAFTYDAQGAVFAAEGDARLTRGPDAWVAAPRMTARLAPGADGKMEVREMEATGGVVAVQGDTRVTGPRARVEPGTGLATVLGGRARVVLYPEEGSVPH